MRVTYDSTAEAMYVYVAKGKFQQTKTLDDRVNVDFGTEGQVLGVEVLFVSRPRVDDITGEVTER